jgi:hypothetical protein
MRRNTGIFALLGASILLFGLAGELGADMPGVPVVSGVVRRDDNQEAVNGANVYVVHTSGNYLVDVTAWGTVPSVCQNGYTGDGVYGISCTEPLAPCNLCTIRNHIGAEKEIGGNWWRGGAGCVWFGHSLYGCSCLRKDFTISQNGSFPDPSYLCPSDR